MRHLPAAGQPVPTATYRLQLHAGFTFADAAGLVDYLADLGVSHLYLSPVLTAAPGSMHGYDVVAHEVSPVLGGEDGLRDLSARAVAAGLGLVVDVVPNHMAVPSPESLNAPLWDVLAHGPGSAYAGWFDVDWAAQHDRLLLPVLGAPLEQVLAAGVLTVSAAGTTLHYVDHVFPVRDPQPGAAVEKVVGDQHYRLAYWRVANDELNYRRFFDVTSLIAVRVEDEEVFAATHDTLLRLARDGVVAGWRIDHPDGLADPAGYLQRLAEGTGGAWVVVEKILEPAEALPEGWPCAGTTGYDALNQLAGVLTDPTGAGPLTARYREATGTAADYPAEVLAAKRLAVRRLLGAEVARLVRLLAGTGLPESHDVSTVGLTDAVTELLVHLDVYRAYPEDAAGGTRLAAAARRAAAATPHRAREIELVASLAGVAGTELATRFGQTTGPVMAKGVEDTAFYRYTRLTALNEVGGDPGRIGVPVEEFHAYCADRWADWPTTMTTLSTHDTKRSEDVRARLLVLAELPTEWAAAVGRWETATAGYPEASPDPAMAELLWQTLVGAWPIDADRLGDYLLKAAREAKRHTSWTDPDEGYEQALTGFVARLLADHAVCADVAGFVHRVSVPGRANSISQRVLQLTMPGVPDVYQGCELWDMSLVDPDNRRPVDFDARRRSLAGLTAPPTDLAADDVGLAKLWAVSRLLRLRRDHPDWFGPDADYRPVPATGAAAEHVVAFARGEDILTVATRLPVGLGRRGGWGDTAVDLPAGQWRNVLATDEAPVAGGALAPLLDPFPAAVLVRDP